MYLSVPEFNRKHKKFWLLDYTKVPIDEPLEELIEGDYTFNFASGNIHIVSEDDANLIALMYNNGKPRYHEL